MRKAVVLEMFGGVGTGTIALKKLGIAIKKVSGYFLLPFWPSIVPEHHFTNPTNTGDLC